LGHRPPRQIAEFVEEVSDRIGAPAIEHQLLRLCPPPGDSAPEIIVERGHKGDEFMGDTQDPRAALLPIVQEIETARELRYGVRVEAVLPGDEVEGRESLGADPLGGDAGEGPPAGRLPPRPGTLRCRLLSGCRSGALAPPWARYPGRQGPSLHQPFEKGHNHLLSPIRSNDSIGNSSGSTSETRSGRHPKNLPITSKTSSSPNAGASNSSSCPLISA
jgi:hypothetical protein